MARSPIKARSIPKNSRFFPGQRWFDISLRTLHLLGIAGLGAGFLYNGIEPQLWRPYLILCLGSGLGMTLLFVWSRPLWLLQVSGQAVLLKLLLLALIPLWPDAGAYLFVAVLIISGLISHAPKGIRHFSPYRSQHLD